MNALNVQILLTGNELMTGDIVDTNSIMLAKKFQDIGIEVTRKITVADTLALLVEEISNITKEADILIINGGLGPTVDDLTSQALAESLRCKLSQNQDALNHLILWAKNKKKILNDANLKQAQLPIESSIIPNRTGSAVGIKAQLNKCDIYCTPGVPSELSIMFNEEIFPAIAKQFSSTIHAHTSRFQVFGYGESDLQEVLDNTFPNWPTEVAIGFRAAPPYLELKLTTQNKADIVLKQNLIKQLYQEFDDHIIEEVKTAPKSLAEHVVNHLKEKGLSITFAESCTGGLLACQLTKVAGSSRVFEAGFVTYSNNMKTALLNVSPQTLNEKGAVSKETVTEMAKGALLTTKADTVIAVSGIAGPSGGTAEKPTGTVWIAWGNNEHLRTHCFLIHGNREYVQKTAMARAFDLMRRHLIGSQLRPNYIK